MNSKEWLSVIQQADNYNPAMTPLILKYGQLLVSEQSPHTSEDIRQMAEERYPDDNNPFNQFFVERDRSAFIAGAGATRK